MDFRRLQKKMKKCEKIDCCFNGCYQNCNSSYDQKCSNGISHKTCNECWQIVNPNLYSPPSMEAYNKRLLEMQSESV